MISRFQARFQDFSEDFKISVKISIETYEISRVSDPSPLCSRLGKPLSEVLGLAHFNAGYTTLKLEINHSRRARYV